MACTSGTEAVTHFSIGTSLNGSGKLLYKGNLKNASGDNTTYNVSTGVTIIIPAGGLDITED